MDAVKLATFKASIAREYLKQLYSSFFTEQTMAAPESFELAELPQSIEMAELPSRRSSVVQSITERVAQESVVVTEIPSLPPTDHGKAAYLVLGGCTLIQAPVWGKPLLHNLACILLTRYRVPLGIWNLPRILYNSRRG